MKTIIELWHELKRLEKDAKNAKYVHRLRKSVIWLKIAKIQTKQEKMFKDGVTATSVIDCGNKEFYSLLDQLGEEILRFKKERKEYAKRYEQLLKQINEFST